MTVPTDRDLIIRARRGESDAFGELVTMSEFGRRASENSNLGIDHGHGSMMMVMGKC